MQRGWLTRGNPQTLGEVCSPGGFTEGGCPESQKVRGCLSGRPGAGWDTQAISLSSNSLKCDQTVVLRWTVWGPPSMFESCLGRYSAG